MYALRNALLGSGTGLTIANVRNNGVLHSGTLIGSAPTGTSSVQISLDSGATKLNAGGSSSWKVTLPKGGSGIWRLGTRHTIKVTAFDSGGNPGHTLTISVRKGINRDINGDGYEDIVIGAYLLNSNDGAVYIFYGSKSGISNNSPGSADATVSGESGQSGNFGSAIALGDVDGNGFADVIVGAPNYTVSAAGDGKVYIFYSQSSSGVASQGAGSAGTTITGESGKVAGFGSSVALGDLDGNGFDDAVVGGPTYTSGSQTGKIYVFQSAGSTGIATSPALSASNSWTSSSTPIDFGKSLAIGEVNGDSYADLLVGDDSGGTAGKASYGAVYLYLGGGSGVNSVPVTSIIASTAIGFGFSVALDDLSGDGLEDAMVSAYLSAGSVYIFHSNSGSGIPSSNPPAPDVTLAGESSSQFGISLSTGDVNGDSHPDILVGANVYNTGYGRAYLFLASNSGSISSVSAAQADAIFTGLAATSYLGKSVYLTDVNGDGNSDALVGSYGDNADDGVAYIFQSGGSSGIPTHPTTTLTGTNTPAGGEFGYEVVWDLRPFSFSAHCVYLCLSSDPFMESGLE